MNTELADLALLFASTFIGATIAFLAALITFTFHHEIRERLIQRGLIVPPNELRPENPALRLLLERQQQENVILHARVQRELPVVRLPPNHNPEDDPNRHLQVGDFPAAWRNRNRDPWAEPPDPRP